MLVSSISLKKTTCVAEQINVVALCLASPTVQWHPSFVFGYHTFLSFWCKKRIFWVPSTRNIKIS